MAEEEEAVRGEGEDDGVLLVAAIVCPSSPSTAGVGGGRRSEMLAPADALTAELQVDERVLCRGCVLFYILCTNISFGFYEVLFRVKENYM